VILLAAVCGLLGLAGCYSSRTRMPDSLQTIAVPVFANKTYLVDYTRKLEVDVTNAVRTTFLQQNRLKLAGREAADLVLEGDVMRVERVPLRVNRYGDPAEVQYRIVAAISLYNVRDAKYVFKGLTVASDTRRPSSGTYDLRRGEQEASGKRTAVENLGRNIAQQVLDHW
jgi:hypothetical protein